MAINFSLAVDKTVVDKMVVDKMVVDKEMKVLKQLFLNMSFYMIIDKKEVGMVIILLLKMFIVVIVFDLIVVVFDTQVVDKESASVMYILGINLQLKQV
jgi:hypothetical protein